ncbi:MAG: cell division protein SepF [Blautia sp.]|nr:cell division protein SepF [Blautia sp.]MDY4516476.1 cell division protein SepF [Lachnospiraceae bacterium]
MGVLDKFLNAMKLNDDDGFDDDGFLDDEIDDEYEEERPVKKRMFKKLEEEDDYDDLRDISSRKPKAQTKMRSSKQTTASSSVNSKIAPMRPRKSSGMEVCVIKPHSMEDAREITETLIANCTVVLNMEGLDVDIAQRIIDFASGSCYAVDGNLQKISSFIFIITPSTVDISGDFQQILNGAFEVPAIHSNF